jgi:hypothetical protein
VKRSAALAIVSSPGETGADTDPVRPRIRAHCKDGPRPCPWFGCKFHLAIDVGENGSIRVIGGSRLSATPTDREIERFVDAAIARASSVGSCVLDLVDRSPDGVTLATIGTVLVVSRERIRQLERKAIKPLGSRIRRRLGRITDADSPTPSGASFVERLGR